MVGRVLLRPEPVDKPEHLHLSISRKLSNQWGTPQSPAATLLIKTDFSQLLFNLIIPLCNADSTTNIPCEI
jgi:hypothetical protein